jgi:hypothetical protein
MRPDRGVNRVMSRSRPEVDGDKPGEAPLKPVEESVKRRNEPDCRGWFEPTWNERRELQADVCFEKH